MHRTHWSRLRASVCVGQLLSLSIAVHAADLPDPDQTPGKTAREVNQGNIEETICVPGYTDTVRPSTSYTNNLKKAQLKSKKFRDKDPKKYEEDHLIPLALGGHPKDKANLWPQPWDGDWGARKKDRLERRLQLMVCNEGLKLREAQRMISDDWKEAFRKVIGEN